MTDTRTTTNMTHAFSGTITLDGLEGRELLTVGLRDSGRIELDFLAEGHHHTRTLAFDDAEHLAALLRDMALVIRTRAGIYMTEVE